ncbi:MAG: isoamylase [Treponema sp.]|uniref:isoamylase n=1 Tax=Treponema sp. TaxID=166 RepID=UPI0025FFC171|nr:isoamylase [Treponema sp.]MBQ8679993.1 isoamylase [Treponema sp.]
MKKIFMLIGSMLLFATSFAPISAKDAAPQKDTYEYDLTLTEISGIREPYISNNYVVFTAPITSNSIGIAFDFEEFRKIHYFKIKKNYGYEGDITSSYYFYILEIPKKLPRISYRLVIDGLWTVDPRNPNVTYNEIENYSLSYIDLPPVEFEITEKLDNGMTHFVCHAESGQKIRLGGTFTNWDSWVYEMKETVPGKYEINIPLHPGTYYYSYYSGITSFLDETNPSRGYSTDGRIVSCITIK